MRCVCQTVDWAFEQGITTAHSHTEPVPGHEDFAACGEEGSQHDGISTTRARVIAGSPDAPALKKGYAGLRESTMASIVEARGAGSTSSARLLLAAGERFERLWAP